MRRKISRTLPVLLIMVALICTLCAFDADETKIYDGADLFTDSEEEMLNEYALDMADVLELDIIIHTTNSTDGLDIMDYTYEFYEENEFGYDGEDGAGIILVIDMGNRELFIYESQPDGADFLYLDSELDDMIDEISPYLSSGDYYEGALQFINLVSTYSDFDDADEDAYDGTGDVVYNTDGERQSQNQVDVTDIAVRFLISAVIASIAVAVMSMNQKSKKVTNPRTYMRDGKLDMREHSDIYTHTTTVKHRINTDNDGGGGSHGGGGGGHFGGSFSGGGSSGHGRGGGF